MNHRQLRLTIELVPSTVWFSSIYKICKRSNKLHKWRELKKELLEEEGRRCWICGKEGGYLEAHEFWEYDDKNHTQKLVGIHHLCDMCHHVKHIGRAGILAAEGRLDYERIVEHFMKVNNCDRDTFESHKEKAFEQWRERSRREWQVDLGQYKKAIEDNSKLNSNSDENLRLKDAIELYREEESAVSNSYEWYRKSAQHHGTVLIGETHVPAQKYGGIWHVDSKRFREAIRRHREATRHLKRVTADYAKGIVCGGDGDVVYTEWGGYEIHGDFRFVWSDYELFRKKSYGTWYCNSCNIPADTEHDKEECHLCQDWHGCGRDCTLSRVRCTKCGASLEI